MTDPNPIIAEAMRGSRAESRHRGIAIVIDARGSIRMAWGNVDDIIFARSMMKPMEAVSLVASGAARAFGLSESVLALSASSQFGEPRHIELLTQWADLIEVGADDIACGAHKPFNPAAAKHLVKHDLKPTVFHNNNCGKHLSLMTVCRHMGWPIAGYLGFDHPVQHYVRGVVEAFTGWPSSERGGPLEACGTPAEPMPFRNFAMGLARVGRPTGLPAPLADGARAIVRAMRSNPELVSGHGRVTSSLVTVTAGRLVVKGGSEGGQAAIVPGEGIAIAVKIDDGVHRAAEVVFIDLLHRAGVLSYEEHREMTEKFPRDTLTYSGLTKTGYMRSVLDDACARQAADQRIIAVA